MSGAMKTKLVTSRLETSSPTAPGSFRSESENTFPAQDLALHLLAQVGQMGVDSSKILTFPHVTLCLNLNLVPGSAKVDRSLVGAMCPLSPQDT